MLFNSYIFVLLFLPITLGLYYGCNHRNKEKEAKWILVIASLIFYGYFDVGYLPVILTSICLNFGCSRFLLKEKSEKRKRCILSLGIGGNIGLLFYMKYWNFFLENVNAVFGSNYAFEKILLPVGISFFTFQQIAYLVDSYRGETKEYGFLEYALFVTFFPKLSMGVLHSQLMPEFDKKENKRFCSERLACGIYYFSVGLAKKVLLADTLGKGVDWAYANVDLLMGADVLAVALLYTLQIYFDFSGYCDMASGIGEMFQISIPQNFNSPYKATSITEFWNRWHMSLSGFLQKYIYFPLGGSRKGLGRSIVNIMIVFLVSGIWHGAAWTFIIWGLLHGLARVLHKIFEKQWNIFPKSIRWFVTFVFLNVTWIFFRSESLGQAITLLRKLVGKFEFKLQSGLLQQFDVLEFTYIEEHIEPLLRVIQTYPQIHLGIFLIAGVFLVLVPKNLFEKNFEPKLGNAFLSMVLLVWCILSFSGISTFLYFNF